MTKEQLLKYAEHGVRERLREIQAELNELARQFPHIVNHQNGATPAVLPIVFKKPVSTDDAPPMSERHDELRQFLRSSPGASTQDIARAFGLTPNGMFKHLHAVAVMSKRYGNKGVTWTLKSSANGSANGAVAGQWDEKRRAKFARASKQRWAKMSARERKERQAKMLAGRSKQVRNDAEAP